jgi:hypothetical protein
MNENRSPDIPVRVIGQGCPIYEGGKQVMNELSNSSDAKQVVAQGYDQVAQAYAELENEAPGRACAG